MLDELDSTRRDNDFKELGTVPGPLQIYVLEGDDIPTLGDTLGTGVLIRGKIRQVIKPAGTNTDAGLTLFVEWGGDGDDEEIPLVVTTNPALEDKLRGEGTTVIDKHLIEAGGRLLRDEIGSCTKVWKRLMTAAVNHGMVTQEKEDEIIRANRGHNGLKATGDELGQVACGCNHFAARGRANPQRYMRRSLQRKTALAPPEG